jgi:hypothetical protein
LILTNFSYIWILKIKINAELIIRSSGCVVINNE